MEKKHFKSSTSKSPLSAAVLVGETLYVSGQLGIDPNTNELAEDGAAGQTAQAIDNIENVLKNAEMTLENVVKTMIFISDINDFTEVNKIYAERFGNVLPARSCVQVVFPRNGAKVEIEAIAVK